jgi:hypothetical protein
MPTSEGTVRRSTIARLRARYFGTWGREWPFEDDYLAELWRDVQHKNEKGNSRIQLHKRYEDCLMRMRECHSFEPSP